MYIPNNASFVIKDSISTLIYEWDYGSVILVEVDAASSSGLDYLDLLEYAAEQQVDGTYNLYFEFYNKPNAFAWGTISDASTTVAYTKILGSFSTEVNDKIYIAITQPMIWSNDGELVSHTFAAGSKIEIRNDVENVSRISQETGAAVFNWPEVNTANAYDTLSGAHTNIDATTYSVPYTQPPLPYDTVVNAVIQAGGIHVVEHRIQFAFDAYGYISVDYNSISIVGNQGPFPLYIKNAEISIRGDAGYVTYTLNGSTWDIDKAIWPASTTTFGHTILAPDFVAIAGTDTQSAVTPAGLKAHVDARGFSNPEQATTTVSGIVELATTTEATAQSDSTRAVTPAGLADRVKTSTTVSAGNGLSGGGALSSNVSLALGTPSTITNATTNSASGTTHTHALTLPTASATAQGIVELATTAEATAQTDTARAVTPAGLADRVKTSTSVTAGNGLSGGGALSSSVTLSLGTPSTITSATTNSASSGTHTHALTLPSASTSQAGIVELATLSETSDPYNDTVAVTPAGLANELAELGASSGGSYSELIMDETGNMNAVITPGNYAVWWGTDAAPSNTPTIAVPSASYGGGYLIVSATMDGGTIGGLIQTFYMTQWYMDWSIPSSTEGLECYFRTGTPDGSSWSTWKLSGIPQATDAVMGKVKLATTTEAVEGTSVYSAVTPAGLTAALAGVGGTTNVQTYLDSEQYRKFGTSGFHATWQVSPIGTSAPGAAVSTSTASSANTTYLIPFVVPRAITVSALSVVVATLASSSSCKVGLYNTDNTSTTTRTTASGGKYRPTTVIAQSGALNCGSTGTKTYTLDTPATLQPGLYMFAVIVSTGTTLRIHMRTAVGGGGDMDALWRDRVANTIVPYAFTTTIPGTTTSDTFQDNPSITYGTTLIANAPIVYFNYTLA